MKTHAVSQLSDSALLHELEAVVARDRVTTAEMLALIAEVDARKLYLPAAYSSMFAYCVGELRLSDDAAAKRIQVARATRRFPVILGALASGRLHLTGVRLLAPFLTEATAAELLEAAVHLSKAEIEQLIAERFPRPDVAARMFALSPGASEHAPGHVDMHMALGALQAPVSTPLSVCTPREHAPGHVDMHIGPLAQSERSSLKPLAPQTFALRMTIRQSTHDKLRYAQELLSHQVPAGDLAGLLDHLLDVAIPRLEQRKFAATERTRSGERTQKIGRTRPRRATRATRHVPADVRRAVWERDGGQCTFVSGVGRRCAARTRIEFDHIEEVARGGEATVAGMRLRCHAHNQYAAELTFGADFMRHKRTVARERRAAAPAPGAAGAAGRAAANDVVPWLRQLGFSAAEARLGAVRCEHIPDASLEARVRVALSGLRAQAAAPARLHSVTGRSAGAGACSPSIHSGNGVGGLRAPA